MAKIPCCGKITNFWYKWDFLNSSIVLDDAFVVPFSRSIHIQRYRSTSTGGADKLRDLGSMALPFNMCSGQS